MKNFFLVLLILATLPAKAATYSVALPGGSAISFNGTTYSPVAITNSASVTWSTNGNGQLTATATAVGTNASTIYVGGTAVNGANFANSTELTFSLVTTNVSYSIATASIATNKIDSTFYSFINNKQAGSSVLTRLAGIGAGTSGDIIYRDATGWTNLPKAADGTYLTLSGGLPAWGAGGGGGGSGNAYTNQTQTWPSGTTNLSLGAWVFGGSVTLSNATVPGTLTADTLSLGSALGIASGGSGATTALGAQIAYSLVPGTNIMAYDAQLQDIANISFSTGDVIYFDGANLARKAIGTNGQVLGVSGGALAYINQTGTGGGGVTNYSALNDVALSSLADNQVPAYNAGTGKWNNRTLASNPLLVSWIGNLGVGSRTNADVTTNILVSTFSIPPANAPLLAGQFLSGMTSLLITNTNSLSSTFTLRIYANGQSGTLLLDSVRAPGQPGQEAYVYSTRLVRESDTTASLYLDGVGSTGAFPGSGSLGFGAQQRDVILVATNFLWDWGATNTLDTFVCPYSASGTYSGLGVTRLASSLHQLTDNASLVLNTAWSAGMDGDTNHAPSRNAVYDWGHTFDTDDDGLPDKAKNLTITGQTIQNSLPVTPTGTNLVLDFGFPVLTYNVATNINLLQSTNRPTASTNTVFTLLRLAGDTVDRTLSWNSNWKRLGTNITTIPSNKVVVLSAMVVGTAESGVTFGIAKEE